jgi:hypothetical protein
MAEQEITYFQEGGTTVTNSRAILGNQTFAMANTTSVSMHKEEPKRLRWILLIILGLMGAIQVNTPNVPTLFWGLSILVAAFSVFELVTAKPKYSVVIGSACGETHAMDSIDKDYISKVVGAINEAIVRRG